MPRRKNETWAKLTEMCRARYPGRSEEDVRADALELARRQMQQGDDADGTYNAAFEYGAALGASGSNPARNYEQVLDARRAVIQMADARERAAEQKAAEWAADPEAAANVHLARNARLAERLAERRAERARLDAAKEARLQAAAEDAARRAASAAVRQLREEGIQFAHAQDVQDEESRVVQAAMTAVWLDDDDADLQDDFDSEAAHQQAGNNAFVAAGHDAEAAMAEIIARAEAHRDKRDVDVSARRSRRAYIERANREMEEATARMREAEDQFRGDQEACFAAQAKEESDAAKAHWKREMDDMFARRTEERSAAMDRHHARKAEQHSARRAASLTSRMQRAMQRACRRIPGAGPGDGGAGPSGDGGSSSSDSG